MSNFNAPTKHPETGEVLDAMWIDVTEDRHVRRHSATHDAYGRHKYGVLFPGDSRLWPADELPDIDPPRQEQSE